MSRPNVPPEAVERFRHAVARLLPSAIGPPVHPVAVAVSGGPDSLALLILADAVFPGNVRALTVDHGLRPESAVEAELVARVCSDRGIPHRILRVPELEGQSANIQALARAARYAVLEAACAGCGIPVLMTAHHADDQAETLLMRLARGSGLGGLVGVRASRRGRDATIVRPLLGYRKAELVAIVRAAGLSAVDDPSNRSPAFDRTAARSLLAGAHWLDPLRMAASADHLADAETALQWMADEAWRGRAESAGETLLVDMEDLPRELVRRLTLRALGTFNPTACPDGPSVDRLIERVGEGRESTLSGVRVSHGRKWRFAVAPPRAKR